MSEHVGLNGHAAESSAPLNGVVARADDAADASSDDGAQRAVLERSLVDAAEALDAARERLQQKEALIKSVLREELLASRERLAAMDREHDERVAAIRAAARAEVERLADEFSGQEGGAQ